MNKVLVAALVAALTSVLVLVPTAGASATGAEQLRGAKNTWMDKSIRKRIKAAGSEGVPVTTVHRWARARGEEPPDEPPSGACPGSVDPSEKDVYAGACQVYPYQCTMNFIYKIGAAPAAEVSDGRNYFIGTAGHCVEHARQPVYIQNHGRYVYVGPVFKMLKGGGNSETSVGRGGLGNDFAVARIAKGRSIDPESPAGGPQEIYTGCGPVGIKFWGHGYGFAVGPGQIGVGINDIWFDRTFVWTGDGLPGDSGSGVTTSNNLAGGILTHISFDPARYGAATHAGTRVTRALTFLGGTFYLVNQDRTTSRATMQDTHCGNDDAGGGNGSSTLSALTG